MEFEDLKIPPNGTSFENGCSENKIFDHFEPLIFKSSNFQIFKFYHPLPLSPSLLIPRSQPQTAAFLLVSALSARYNIICPGIGGFGKTDRLRSAGQNPCWR